MRRLLLALVLLALVLTACSHPGQPTPTPSPPARAESVGAGAVHVDGSDAADVQVRDVGHETAPTPQLRYSSDTYELTPSGPRPATTVHLALQAALPTGFGAVVATRATPDQPWTYLPAQLAGDRASVTFTTTHFSRFAAVGLDLPALAQTFKSEFVDAVSSKALQNDIAKPKCDNEDAARRDGYKITSTTKTDTVYWCLGIEHGGRVLKVTDHRRYPLIVGHSNLAVLGNQTDKLELSSLTRLASGKTTVVGPGSTVTYDADLNGGRSGAVAIELDGASQTLYALQTGIETLVDMLAQLGGSELSGLSEAKKQQRVLKLMDKMLSSDRCASAWSKSGRDIVSRCFTADELLSGLGSASLLVAPVFAAGGPLSFRRSEWNALVDAVNGHDGYRIAVAHVDDTAQVYASYCRQGADDRRPAEVVWGCDSTGAFEKMTWTKWGDDEALGTGIAEVTDCKPACASSKRYKVPVAVRLSDPRRAQGCNLRWYSTITLAYTGQVPPKAAAGVTSTYLGHPAAVLRNHGSPC
jgi:hypothetical protein